MWMSQKISMSQFASISCENADDKQDYRFIDIVIVQPAMSAYTFFFTECDAFWFSIGSHGAHVILTQQRKSSIISLFCGSHAIMGILQQHNILFSWKAGCISDLIEQMRRSCASTAVSLVVISSSKNMNAEFRAQVLALSFVRSIPDD